MTFAEQDLKENRNYIKLLEIMCNLSKIYSDSDIPFIYYRAHENLFCRCFGANNISRSDTAYDAKINTCGIGLKTFTCNSNSSSEKIAEFNALSSEFKGLNKEKLAIKLAEFRNERIEFANSTYGISNAIYHIAVRKNGKIGLFETDYSKINLDKINSIKQTKAGITFKDDLHEYSFNASKSTLFRKFEIPSDTFWREVKILENPFDLLLNLVTKNATVTTKREFVIIPLYSYKKGEKFVYPKSGLNIWNAGGRKRDLNEIYLQNPSEVREIKPNFFPNLETSFNLRTPDGEILSAKICQQGGKAIMTNPNKALSKWLLRKVLKLNEGELLTYERLKILGIDCVIIYKNSDLEYEIDFAKIGDYEKFISGII
ncbi:MAG: restriction endonuclease [Campylobacter sp.]|nr:restriction endonuclease [Campylobacter sp.]MBR7047816.1 restriction endonuclease [Campylobacter sp.]